ncbi:MAG: methyltransferase domain-containing protein [Bacteroidales bacterium]|nr:methyltransferase domain-containing protein [Bacteroidales bacterium]
MNMSYKYSTEVEKARSYYNSKDADNFYYRVWGGEDLHIGLYKSEDEDIYTASRRTNDRMAHFAQKIDENTKIVDLGGGFGGTARRLAERFGCHVTVINLSEAENERGRQKNREQGLDHLIDIIDGSYDEIPYPDETFDIAWSQDAILHSDNRKKVIEETARVLKPGGDFILSDPMQADNCNESVLQPIYDRINLSSLGSPQFYRKICEKVGLEEQAFEEMPHQLANHYSRVREETIKKEDYLKNYISNEYIEKMKNGLVHWVRGGKEGNLTWGIFHFKKNGANN